MPCYKEIIVLTAIIIVTHAGLEEIPDGILATRLSLAQCIGKVAYSFFHKYDIILVSVAAKGGENDLLAPIAFDKLLFYELFASELFSIIIKMPDSTIADVRYIKKIDNYIIYFRNATEVSIVLEALEQYSTWNPHAKFLIASAVTFTDPMDVASKMIEQLWLKKIINGVVLLRRDNSTTYVAYTWAPFSNSHCSSGAFKMKLIDTCINRNLSAGKTWFPNKIPHNFNGCPMMVQAVVWPPYVMPPIGNASNNAYNFTGGVEINLLNTIAEVSNLTIVYSTPKRNQDWGEVFQNGTATGTLGRLKNEEYQIAVGSYAATLERNVYFDYVAYNIPESLTWCVPHVEETDQWKKLLRVLPAEVWLLCLVSYFVTGVTLWAFSVLTRGEANSYKTLSSCMQNVFSVLLNLAVKIQPRTFIARLIFFSWVFFALNMTAVYESKLISVLTKPAYNQQVKSVTDILNRKMKMWILPTSLVYFKEESDSINRDIERATEVCEDLTGCLLDTAFNKNSATCTPRLYLKYAVKRYTKYNGEPLLHCFGESIVTYPLEMVLVKGFPLKEYFNKMIERITAAGLIAQWEKELFDQENMNRTYMVLEEEVADRLAIWDVELPFMVLFIGISFATVTFLIELYANHIRFQTNLVN